MDKRHFSYVAGRSMPVITSTLSFTPILQLITRLRTKFKLDPEVYRQHYQRLRGEKGEGTKKSGRIEMISL